MTMEQKTGFSYPCIALGVVTAALAESLSQSSEVTARQFILQGLPVLAALCLLSALGWAFWQSGCHPFIQAVLLLWLAAELCVTAAQAVQLCQQEFASMALVGFLPLLLLAGWKLSPEAWSAPARVLWWFAALGAVVFLLGAGGQMQWYRLLQQSVPQRQSYVVCAEFFALPLLCPRAGVRRAAALPVWSFGVQAACLTAFQLLFGAAGQYRGAEMLQVWGVGSLSRLDAFLLLVWLCCAMLRVCVLCAALRWIGQQLIRKNQGGALHEA